MLTSSLVAPNALNLKLPGQANATTPPPQSDLDAIVIADNCGFTLNGQSRGAVELEVELRRSKRAARDYAVTIGYGSQTPTECVVQVMDMARRLDIEGVLVAPKAR